MESHHHQRHDNIAESHQRRNDGGHLGDALHPADNHHAQNERQGYAGGQRRHREGVGHGHGYAVGLHGGKEEAAAEDSDGCKHNTQHPLTQAVLNEAERTAPVAAGVLELVHLGKRGLHKGRGRPQESHHPHPEHGAGPAEGDGRGHAHDVPSTHTPGQRDTEGLKGGNAALLPGLLAKERA